MLKTKLTKILALTVLTVPFLISKAHTETKTEAPVQAAEEAAAAVKAVKTEAVKTEAAKAHEDSKLDSSVSLKESALKDATQNNSDKTYLVNTGNDLYVDLAKEISLSEREREKKSEMDFLKDKLAVIQQELSSKIAELETLKNQLNQEITKKEDANENIKLLVTLYESISADQAASLLKQLPFSVTLKMLQTMSPKKSSKILAAMEPNYAAEISRRLIKQPQVASSGPVQAKKGE